ncbi:hypothetical protein B0T17DRAFT_633999 [Bombardia bombarda]|uniref:Uncharacterized protein n=1 Tax=Bombardia bombarda TaxID=252184 RepID=A0AA39X8Q8_9PEZI|nr:hypothetical protein B0T17DRAFT_633999 [Bombardia bombarda]
MGTLLTFTSNGERAPSYRDPVIAAKILQKINEKYEWQVCDLYHHLRKNYGDPVSAGQKGDIFCNFERKVFDCRASGLAGDVGIFRKSGNGPTILLHADSNDHMSIICMRAALEILCKEYDNLNATLVYVFHPPIGLDNNTRDRVRDMLKDGVFDQIDAKPDLLPGYRVAPSRKSGEVVIQPGLVLSGRETLNINIQIPPAPYQNKAIEAIEEFKKPEDDDRVVKRVRAVASSISVAKRLRRRKSKYRQRRADAAEFYEAQCAHWNVCDKDVGLRVDERLPMWEEDDYGRDIERLRDVLNAGRDAMVLAVLAFSPLDEDSLDILSECSTDNSMSDEDME